MPGLLRIRQAARALARGEVPMGVPGWRRGIEAAWAEIQDRLRIAPAPARTGS